MKLLLFSLLLVALHVNAQQYPVTGITISLPANPDANTANWKGGTSMLTISAMAKLVNGRPDVRVEDCKILVIIKKSGSKACGTFTGTSAPSANFTTVNKVWSGNNAVALLGQDCILTPGDYELCVQLFGNGPRGLEAISDEKCKAFSVKGNEQQSYQAPQLLSPVDGAVINEGDRLKPVTFRWTPVIPKPVDPVTYRLRVWQLMEGQNSSQAIIQQPLLGNDVGQYMAIVRLPTPPPGQKNPETYVWNVQALNRDGKPIGENNGTSGTFTITVNPVNDAPVAIKLASPANNSAFTGNEQVRFSWSVTNARPGLLYKIKIVEIKGDESPDNALRTNKPFFEKDSLNDIVFQYPSSAPAMQQGKRYAWNVQTCEECTDEPSHPGKNRQASESFVFRVATKDAREQHLKLIAPVNGAIVNEVPGFSWAGPFSASGDGSYKIKIIEIISDQSPEEALRGNKPFFEKDSIKYLKGNKPFFEKDSLKWITSFPYPPSAPKLVAGKQYAWQVQALNRDGKPVGENNGTSEAFSFTIPLVPKERNQKQLKLMSPVNGAILNSDPTFSWGDPSDVNGDGSYKIKIVEIKGDESPENAIRGNKPFFEKDSIRYLKGNKPFFEKDSGWIITTFPYPASAPKLQKAQSYAWQVQALNRERKPGGDANLTSEVRKFSMGDTGQQKSAGVNGVSGSFITTGIFPCVSVQLKVILGSCVQINQNENQYQFYLEITYSPQTGYAYPTFNDSTSGVRFSGLALPHNVYTTLRPNIGLNFNMGTITIPYTVNVVMPAGQNGLTISFLADDMGIKPVTCRPTLDPTIIATLPPCSCNPCAGKQTTFGTRGSSPEITFANNGLMSVGSTVTHTPSKVTRVTAQIVDVQRQGEAGCLGCNKESSAFGNLTAGMLNNSAGNIAKGGKGYGKLIEWKFASPRSLQNIPYSLQMLFPPLNAVGCCKDSIRVCMRWSFTDENNVACDTLICNTVTREYKKPGANPDDALLYEELVAPMGSPYTDWYKQDTNDLPKDFKMQVEALWQKREQERETKITKEDFEENVNSAFLYVRNLRSTGTDLKWDPDLKVRVWNTQCGNGNFETGQLDTNEWSGAAGSLEPVSSIYNIADFSPVPVAQNLPVDVIVNNHSIVSHANDPVIGALLQTTASPSSQYAFRLGNRAALNVIHNDPSFKGGDILAKRFIVTGNGIINFKYALVMEASSHAITQRPYFSVSVYNANGLPIHNAVFLDASSSSPNRIIYSDNSSSFFQHATYIPSVSNINYRGWTSAKIDLSQFIGQEVKVVFLTANCFVGGHFGYAYIDDWNGNCNAAPDPGPVSGCNEFTKQVTSQVSVVNKNAVKFTATIKAGPKPIKQIRIAVVNFETGSKNKECLSCVTGTSGTISVPQSFTGSGKDAIEGMVYATPPLTATCAGCPPVWSNGLSSEVTWGSNSGPGYNLADGAGDQSTTFTVHLPKKTGLDCCDDTVRICIRYSFTDVDCRTCDTIICYRIVNRATITQMNSKSVGYHTSPDLRSLSAGKPVRQSREKEIAVTRQSYAYATLANKPQHIDRNEDNREAFKKEESIFRQHR
jgi:hypothetical protein